jgi:hypothetical protein
MNSAEGEAGATSQVAGGARLITAYVLLVCYRYSSRFVRPRGSHRAIPINVPAFSSGHCPRLDRVVPFTCQNLESEGVLLLLTPIALTQHAGRHRALTKEFRLSVGTTENPFGKPDSVAGYDVTSAIGRIVVMHEMPA